MAVSAEPAQFPVPWWRGRYTSWITTLDHKRIGILYLVTCLVFFAAGGVLALLMRTQLAQANGDFLTRDSYNEVMTLHGTAMVFLVVVPILAGFGNFLVPLMIGARDVAFPRLNALSYWLFLFGGLVLFASFFASGGAPKTGWTIYAPLSEKVGGDGVDFLILSLHILSVSSLVGAINFVVTIHRLRAPGMTWMRVPLFVWSIEVYAALLIVVLPVLSVGLTMLLLDRQGFTHFFEPDQGGNAVLWQHVFWFFGHPEVYIMILPVMGIVSEVLPVFSRKPIFGYTAIVFSTVAIGFYSLLVWAHHMFTVGLSTPLLGFFMISSMIIAVPTGVKILNWIATTWRGNLILDTPMLFALGFIALFTIGGLSGIFVAAFPFDWQAHDTYFIVAHLHYVLFGGSMFGVFAGLYYWWPKIFGRVLARGAREAPLLALVHRLQSRVLPAAPARAGRDGPADLYVRQRRLGGGEPDLDDRRVRDGGRLPRLRRERDLDEATPGRAGRERPMAGRHARVVHDLAAAAAQFRQSSLRDERSASPRPAPPDLGAALMSPSPWLRLMALAGAAGTFVAVVSGSVGLGTGHRVLAALALPPLAGVAAAAWISHRRLLPTAVASLALFGLAAAITAPGLHLALSAAAFAATLVLVAQSLERRPRGLCNTCY